MRSLLALLLATSVGVVAAQSAPSPQDVERRMKELREAAPSLIDRAAREAGGSARRVQPETANSAQKRTEALDPAQVARQYARLQNPENPADKAMPVMVFVSTSMPQETLKRLSRESARSGVPLLLRGLRYGMGQANVQRALKELEPYYLLGANLLIHPEAFDNYSVDKVPTFVVDPEATSGCADGQCLARARRVVGEVTLEFALDEIAQQGGTAARAAADALATLRPRGH